MAGEDGSSAMVGSGWSKPETTKSSLDISKSNVVESSIPSKDGVKNRKDVDPPVQIAKPVVQATKPTPAKPKTVMTFKPRQTIAATAVKPAVSSENTAPKQTTVTATHTETHSAKRVSAPVKNYSFEVQDPYDPMKPNDYLEWCQERIEAKKQEQLEKDNLAEIHARQLEQKRVEKERADALAAGDMSRVKASMGRGRGRGSVSNLPAWMTEGNSASGLGNISSEPQVEVDTSVDVAKNYMNRMGYEEGSGLGRAGQGISKPISVTQVSGGQGRVTMDPSDLSRQNEEDNSRNITGTQRKAGMFMNPSCIVLVKNMVGPGELLDPNSRDLLGKEIYDECASKYGPVRSCVVDDISQTHRSLHPPEEECVRCFVYFEKQEFAVKALRDLNNRFFGGRRISSTFFSEERFNASDLAPSPGEW